MGVGVGLVGELFYLDLDGPGGHERLVAKLAAESDETRFVATVLNMYGREVAFYTDLSARTPVGHPQCHYAAHDPETQDTVLLLEDVSARGHALDQIAGATLEEARPAIRSLARLHAAFWDDAQLADLAWLPRLCDEPYMSSVRAAFESSWPRVGEVFPDALTPAIKKFGDTFAPRIAPLFAKLVDGPNVLSHGDWRLDNLFVTEDGWEVIAVDWQLVDRSVGPRDLAYLVSQSLNLDDEDDYERALAIYLADLAEQRVEPDAAWAWDRYRYGALLGFGYPVIATGLLTVEDPRHLRLTRALLDRSLRALEALDAFDLPL
jgi:hypothetical protein